MGIDKYIFKQVVKQFGNLSFHFQVLTFVYWINYTIVVINSGRSIGLAMCFWYPASKVRDQRSALKNTASH